LNYKIGKNAFIHLGCYFGGCIKIGENTVVGRNCSIVGNIVIGDNCSITAYTCIQADSHYKNSPMFAGYTTSITIGDYAWIGLRSVILPGVSIGAGAIIGANSTVTRDVPACKVFAGSPAKEISIRSPDVLKYNLNYHPPFN
jgi:maltose O-acetyltransferase